MAIVDGLDGTVAGALGSGTFAEMFLNNGGNVPVGGTDPVSGAYFSGGSGGSCATPYFSAIFVHCDDFDALSGYWAGSAIGLDSGSNGQSEQLYVRSAVPERSTWVMMLIGFAGYRKVQGKAAFA